MMLRKKTFHLHPATPRGCWPRASGADPARGAGPALVLLGLILVLLPAGCRQPSPPAAETVADRVPDGVARTELDRGLIKVTVELQPSPARLSDEPTLTLTIDAARGVAVEKPPFGEAIGSFLIRDFREPLPETRGDREIRRQIYTLEPVETGPQHIAPIAVSFTDRRASGDGQRHTIETESLAVEITSVLEQQAPSLDALRPLAGPLELPPPAVATSPWLAAGVLAAVIAAAAGWWLYRRRRRDVEQRALSPQEWAYLELDALLQERLAERDVKLFYVRLTAVVRRFIERTTGVHAPEQTTEEFLREIGRGQLFSADERARLKAFLESADLVKFAARQPTAADIEQTFQRARDFLGLPAREGAA